MRTMEVRFLSLVFFILTVFPAMQAQAAITIFTDPDRWQAALSGRVVTEDFNDLGMQNDLPLIYSLPGGMVLYPASSGKTRISDFAFSRIGEGLALQTFQTVDFRYPGQSVLGYGFDYADLDWSGADLRISDFSAALPMTGDADPAINPEDFAFFGFIADDPTELESGFSIVINGYEGYALDNLRAITRPVSAVPLPASLPLFLSGIFVFLLLRRPLR